MAGCGVVLHIQRPPCSPVSRVGDRGAHRMTHSAHPTYTNKSGHAESPGKPVDVEAMKREHVRRLVVARGALPPEFDDINDYQKYVKKEISKGGPINWNP